MPNQVNVAINKVIQTLTIRNFGPIRDIHLELRQFNIIIGKNATGKSTIAKVLAVCRYFSYIVGSEIEFKASFLYGLRAWGLEEFWSPQSRIIYACEDYEVDIQSEHLDSKQDHTDIGEDPELNCRLKAKSQRFVNLLDQLRKLKPENSSSSFVAGWRIPTSFYKIEVASVLDNPFYIPTERGLQSIFSLGRASMENISDSLFQQLAELDSMAAMFTSETLIEPLQIKYQNDVRRGLFKKDDGDFYSISKAASGYKSAIPIVLAIKFYNEWKKKSKTFFIEEPELNLFPDAQDRMQRFFVESAVGFGHSFLLTTHSPYILTSLNNLMMASKVGQTSPETEQIIEKKYWIDHKIVSAHMLLENGSCENILDRELSMIDASRIDQISTELNNLFDRIQEIELKNQNN